ncbi:MAG: D-aminoacylase [Planctomycetota bacterium]|nr:D-aminoacylase [Planctomycetaceae bacterium]MDQ3329602.1 D-aminoacylase [Planctomycetota bacterium]
MSIRVRSLFVWLVVATGPASLIAQDGAAPPAGIECDVLLKGGSILDGMGGDAVVGDVAIQNDRIVAVGAFEVARAGRTIDCTGLVVAPGFIDLHSHSDGAITEPNTRSNANYITQGCTTVVTGNCGSGPVDVAKYFEDVNSAGTGTNVIHLLPQGSLREKVMGKANRPPTAEELTEMKSLAEKAMNDGAIGMSTGLIYVPSSYAKTDELVEIAKVVAQHGGLYASHIRGEGNELLGSVDEAISIGRDAGLPVHISHFKATGKNNWGTLRAAADLIERARKAGEPVTADQYPYVASSTSLEATLIPTWASEGGRDELRRRLKDEKDLPRLRKAIADELAIGDLIMISSHSARPQYVGREVRQIATDENRDVVDLVVEMHLEGAPRCVKFGMSEDDVQYAMALPWVATASDGGATIASADRPHPRNFGTFPRKIGHYARDRKAVTLAHAVRSATGLPADILRLTDRGYVRPGYVADIAVFDPETVRDRATYEQPYQYSEGMRWVFVNGVPAIHDGTVTGALAGKAIKRPAAIKTANTPAGYFK